MMGPGNEFTTPYVPRCVNRQVAIHIQRQERWIAKASKRPKCPEKLRRIWVDGTYRGHLLEWVILHYRFRLQPVLRSDDQHGFVVLPRRWVVERTFAWITQCRRLGKDYEGLPESSEAMIYIAMTRLMVRRLAA
jgi:transposase